MSYFTQLGRYLVILTVLFFGISCSTSKADHKHLSATDFVEKSKAPKKRIALLFEHCDDHNLDSILSFEVISMLRRSGSVLILNNNNVLSASLKNASEVLVMRDTVGANAIITGRIESFGALKNGQVHAVVRLFVYSTESGELVASIEGRSEVAPSEKNAEQYAVKLAAHDLFSRLLRIIKSKISWSASVKDVSPDGVLIIGAGSEDGVSLGDVFVVRSEGTLITDTETGAVIGRENGFEKGSVEVSEILGKHVCRAVVISGSGFKQGDVVYNF